MNPKDKFKAALTAKDQNDAKIANDRLLERQAEKQAFIQAVNNYSIATTSLFRDVRGWVKDTGLNVKTIEKQMITPAGNYVSECIKINKGTLVVSLEPQTISSLESKGTIKVVIENILRDEQYALILAGMAQENNGVWEFVTLLSGRVSSRASFSEEVFFEFLTNVFAKN
ncbi:hypothetical protein J8631_24725 [Serratia fonticola]|uniref:hypothetical protein n=1 Tax=Serratia fonticola TaxID=47917 RepID=UPI001AE62D21|nr:hypothetical protein [Serratia fonticola]MBP1038788.1 hypothetical protein [Serratia fonticola]CAI1133986.1 Uncharacterised protein [Serratia fonticola]